MLRTFTHHVIRRTASLDGRWEFITAAEKKNRSRLPPVTFADCHGARNICLGLVDIVSCNRYAGRYSDRPEDVARKLNEEIRWLDSPQSRGGKGKPLIMSEFGAGAIPGYRDRRAIHWSEEYQARVLDESLRVYLNHPRVCGAAIWQFCDVRVTEEGCRHQGTDIGWWYVRPRTMNNKGTVDEYRRPKLCYEVVKRRMREAGLT